MVRRIEWFEAKVTLHSGTLMKIDTFHALAGKANGTGN
jgi:hypothetical protein